MDNLEPWEEVIINSTNQIYARRMIKKIKEYRAKYKGIDVNSIAEQFASNDDEGKKEWALEYNNMQSIVKICRLHRRIQSESDREAEEKARRTKHDPSYGKNYKERYGDWYD
jgi:hypothetical protein